jgi:hypothetical protein
MMHAAPLNAKDSRDKSMVLTSSAFIRVCKDLKVFPVSLPPLLTAVRSLCQKSP